jgi:hypothetical protein
MNDPNNCGACGATATTCVNGLAGPPPEPLFECGAVAEGLAVDATSIYFMCDGVLRSAVKGSWATTKLAEGEWTYTDAGLQIEGGFLYWAWRSTARTGRVRRMPVGGHAGVTYVIDAVLEKPVHGRVVDSTGRTVTECDQAGSLAAIGDVLYVSDHTGVRAMNFDGTDSRLVTAKRGVLAANGSTLAIAGDGFTTYQNGTGSSPTAPLGFRVEGVIFGADDDVVWTRGTSNYVGELFEGGETMLAGIDRTTRRAQIRVLVDREATFLNVGRTIGPMTQDASWVYFGTSGTLGKPATISRFAK